MQTKVRGEIEQCLSLSPSTEKVDITRFLDYQRSCSSGVSESHTPSTPTDLDSPSMEDEEPMSLDSPSPGVSFGVRFRSPSDTDSQSSMTREVSILVCTDQWGRRKGTVVQQFDRKSLDFCIENLTGLINRMRKDFVTSNC